MKTASLVLLASFLMASGCLFGPKEGHFQVKATDGPVDIDDFSAVLVQVTKVLVHRAGEPGADDPEGQETGAGWQSYPVSFNRQTVDLLQVTDGDTWEFFNKTVAPASYTQLRFEIKSARGTLLNGTRVDVEAPPALKFVQPFTIEAGKTTSFVADMNVHRLGEMQYRLQPNAGQSKVMGPA